MRRLLQRFAVYAFHICVVRPLLRWIVGARYRRRHLVPEGPCLVVSNHNSHLDAAVLMSLFPLRRLARVHPVAAADYFGSSWFMRILAMLLMNGIPIQRRPVGGLDPLSPVVERLKAGDSLIFFPEGSRGEAGVVAKFRPGIGMLVRSVPGLLVVPVFLSGPERIWPRGNVVPVPLTIDANVGRPRSYPATEDVRSIAERVRSDVLALAPLPPPVPGPRPAPPVRVAVCSIDGERRHELFLRLTERLGKLGRTLGVSGQVLEADAAGMRETTGPIPVGPSPAWLVLLAGVFRTGGRFRRRRFVDMVERAWVNEALGHGRETRFVTVDGNDLVDVMAWAEADFYRGVFDESGLNHLKQYLAGERKIPTAAWWRFLRKAPEVWLINVFGLARPPIPDLLVHLTLPASEVMQRLRSRGERLQSFENEPFLERLGQAYRHVGVVLGRRSRVEVLELDVSASSPDELLGRIEATCRRMSERSVGDGLTG